MINSSKNKLLQFHLLQKTETETKTPNSSEKPKPKLPQRFKGKDGYKLKKILPVTYDVPEGERRYRCNLNTKGSKGEIIPIQRWCIVDDKTGEISIQQEPATSPYQAEQFREEEKNIQNDAQFQKQALTIPPPPKIETETKTPNSSEKPKPKLPQRFKGKGGYKFKKILPVTYDVPEGQRRYRCNLNTRFSGKIIPIQRWCIVDDTTGEISIQQEPAISPSQAEQFRAQEKGIQKDTQFQKQALTIPPSDIVKPTTTTTTTKSSSAKTVMISFIVIIASLFLF